MVDVKVWTGKVRVLLPLLCLVSGLGLVYIGLYWENLHVLEVVYEVPQWGELDRGLASAAAMHGYILVAAAACLFALALNGSEQLELMTTKMTLALKDFHHDLSSSLRTCIASGPDIQWLMLCIGLALLTGGYYLSRPMMYDEAYSFLKYVNGPLPGMFFYPLPNNHVLHTILVKGSVTLFGAHPFTIRLPAFIAGLALVPATFCLARRLLLGRSGYLATLVVALYPFLIHHSTMARGYSLLLVLTLATAYVGLHVVDNPSLTTIGLLAFVASLGMFVMPSMLLGLAGITLWLGSLYYLKTGSVRVVVFGFVAPLALLTVLLSVVLYTPSVIMSNGISTIVANSYVRSTPLPLFLDRLLPHLQSSFQSVTRHVPDIAILAAGLLIVGGFLGTGRQRNWAALLFAPLIVVGSLLMLLLKRSIPFDRTWMYLVPVVLIQADMGMTYLFEKVPRSYQCIIVATLAVGGLVYGVSLLSDDTIAEYGSFPEAKSIVRRIQVDAEDSINVTALVPADYPTYFYVWYYDLPSSSGVEENSIEYYVVKRDRYELSDLTDEPADLIFEYGQAALYRQEDIPP
jgi:hypothetical protein